MIYKTYIFDFDYTLADATVGIVECVNYALNKMGIEKKDKEDIRKTVGMTLSNMLSTLTGITDENSAKQFFTHFMHLADKVITDNTILFPDTISILSRLKEHGCNTAIVTTKVRYRVEEALVKYNITKLVDRVVGLEDVTEPKPSPEGLLNAISHLGSDKQSVLFTGDSLLDANAAANAGVDFAAVLTGTTEKQSFLALPHIYIANNLTEIIDYTAERNL